MIGWLLLIFLPAWSFTKWIASSGVFPAFLAILYVVGVIPLVVEAGPGIIAEFGTSDGVIRLLADPDVALIAWIHILVFDQLVGILIYSDNMQQRMVPLPIQSLILFLTLMFGPAGFLVYYLVRVAHKRVLPLGAIGGRSSS
jgi:hypothetical protein